MQAFGVLDRYIGKTIFNTIMMTLFMLVSLSGIIKFVDQLKKSGQGSYDALGAGLYTILSVPKDIQIFFPMAALLGALLGLGMLAQRSELVVMQASGFTRLQVALAVMKTAIPLVLLTMAIGEWVAPQGEQMARNYRAQQMYGGSLLSTQQGLWAKDGHNFVYIERVKGNDELGGVSIYAFNPERRLQSVRYAASAKFDSENKVWRLSQVDESDLLALMEDGQKGSTASVCTCTTKCKAGAVNTNCPICKNNMSECTGPEPQETQHQETEAPQEEPKNSGSGAGGLIVFLVVALAGGGAALYYFKFKKPRADTKGSDDLDEYDFGDDENLEDEEPETEFEPEDKTHTKS
mgnify:CR=1 FL=1